MKKLLAGALVALGLVLALLASATWEATRAAVATPDMSVAYGVSPAHDGYIADSALAPPLKRLWAVDLKGGVSYPLVVDNQVYVMVGHLESQGYGGRLVALDVRTGAIIWGPIEQG